MTSPLSLQPVGILHSPYKEKFAVPRQPGLVPSARARLELLPPCNDAQTLRGIEQFSHLWLIFQFHECASQGWHPTVRPPRLGGNERVGVFASRSPFRPNGLGLSVVQLLGVHQQGPRLWLELAGIDLVDGTPILDIKPYVPYADSHPQACGGLLFHQPCDLPGGNRGQGDGGFSGNAEHGKSSMRWHEYRFYGPVSQARRRFT